MKTALICAPIVAALVLGSTPARAAEPAGSGGAARAITISSQNIPAPYSVLGEVRVTVHQTELFPAVPTRQRLNDGLRAEAGRLGADAVIFVVYEKASVLNDKGFAASGKAIKFQAPAPSPSTASTALLAPGAVTGPNSATAPSGFNAPNPSGASLAPAPVTHASSADAVILSSDDIGYRKYSELGAVSATAHQTALIPDHPVEQDLDAALRAKAFALGADAVVLVKYKFDGVFGSAGSTAEGKAVKFD